MPRLPDGSLDSDTADRLRTRRRGELTELDRVLLHSPPVADGWNSLLGAIRERTTIADLLRELLICRVAVLNHAEYEWAAHAPLAAGFGADAVQLEALRSGVTGVFDDRTQTALDLAGAMTTEIEVPDELFERVRAHFDDREIVELTATIGAYNLVSRFLVAMRIEPSAPRNGAGNGRPA